MSDADKEERQNAILAAAKSVFAEKGFHATTVADVARAADLSYGTIYWYFGSKEELFHSLMEAQQAALREAIAVALASDDGSPEGRFVTAVRATFEFFETDRAATKLLFLDSLALGGRIERHLYGIHERFIGDIEALIVRAQGEKAIRQDPPRMIAFSVAALIGQIALRRLTTDDGLPADRVAEFVVSFCLRGLLVRRP